MTKSEVGELKRGVVGTKKTLDKMHLLVAKGKLDPTMQKIATWIRLQVPHDYRGSSKELLDRIFTFVRKHGIFQRDPFQIEKIEHPIAAMEPVIEARRKGLYKGPGLFVGDCDTLSGVYLATLAGILGFHYAWETAKVDRGRPDEFSHVWTAFKVGDEWYPLDPSTKGASPGWRPPVPADRFARWPEKEITETLGMSGMNGAGRNGSGLGQGPYVPEDYFGYGRPTKESPGKPEIPIATPSNMQPLTEYTPAIPRGEIEPGLNLIKRVPMKGAASRPLGPTRDQPDDHGPPYYSDGGRHPYYKVNRQPYPPGSPWNKKLPVDMTEYRKTGPYYQVQEPGTPERQVRIVMGNVSQVKNGRIIRQAKRFQRGGMGQADPLDVAIAEAEAQEREIAARNASKSTWDTISDTIKEVAPTLAQAAADRVAKRYRDRLNRATRRVTGVPIDATPTSYPSPDVSTPPTPWYKQPWVLIGGAVVVGGAAYIMTSSGPKRRMPVRRRKTTRRRRRR